MNHIPPRTFLVLVATAVLLALLVLLLSGVFRRPAYGAPSQVGHTLLGGLATWYDDGPGYYAAAGPEVRRTLGANWRGQAVTVVAENGERTIVTLSDWCACGPRNGVVTLLDLSIQAFADLTGGDLGVGVIVVDVVERRRLVARPDRGRVDRAYRQRVYADAGVRARRRGRPALQAVDQDMRAIVAFLWGFALGIVVTVVSVMYEDFTSHRDERRVGYPSAREV